MEFKRYSNFHDFKAGSVIVESPPDLKYLLFAIVPQSVLPFYRVFISTCNKEERWLTSKDKGADPVFMVDRLFCCLLLSYT